MSCATCRFYKPKSEEPSGVCRRYPPSASAGLPAVAATDWCGEFVRYVAPPPLNLGPPFDEMFRDFLGESPKEPSGG